MDAACKRGEKCLYIAFEESPGQIIRNMRSIGMDLERHVNKGTLLFHASRPTLFGLESHLAVAHSLVEKHRPSIVVIDPVTNLMSAGRINDVHAMLMRLVDYLKGRGITTMMTTLTHGRPGLEQTDVEISSLIDTWILLREIESGGERNRGLYILKPRGMAHSNQIREFRLTDKGIDVLDVYLGSAGVLTGSARLSQESRDRDEEVLRKQESERHRAQAEARRKALEAQIVALQAELVAQNQTIEQISKDERSRVAQVEVDREAMASSRRADKADGPARNRAKGGKR